MSDLTIKYQRLAQEYGKLKAQNQVLKKAVIDGKEDLQKLNDDLQMKEQVVRRSQQEIESSNFRSQQMIHRIEILQAEIEHAKVKRIKSPANSTVDSQSVLDVDLQMKISENERLHKELYDAELQRRNLEQLMNDKLVEAQTEIKCVNGLYEELQSKHNDLSVKTQENKAFLEKKVFESETSLSLFRNDSEKQYAKLSKENTILTDSVNHLEEVINGTVVFNDCQSDLFKKLKVSTYDKRFQVKYKHTIKTAQDLLMELCDGLKKFHDNTRQRSLLYPVDTNLHETNATTLKLCDHLSKHSVILQNIYDCFQICFVRVDYNVSLQEKSKIALFVEACKKYSAFISTLLPYQLRFLVEECHSSLCVPNLQVKNVESVEHYQRFFPIISRLMSYLCLFFHAHVTSDDVLSENLSILLQKMCSVLNELHLFFKDFSKIINSKIALEYQLPTTTKAPALRTANEFLLSSLLQLSTATAKLSGFLRENSELFVEVVKMVSAADQSLAKLHLNATNFLQVINTYSAPISVPYDEAIQGRSDGQQDEDQSDLLEQLKQSANQVQELEQQKEHWMLENKLLQMKISKLNNRLENSDDNNTKKPSELVGSRQRTTSNAPTDTSSLGTVAVDDSHNIVVQESTEELIKQHMTSRLGESNKKVQFAESKALHLESECKMMQKHLLASQNKIKGMEEALSVNTQKVSQLQDELAVTRRSYEEQLSLMSEHLAAMNDKLASQKDVIDALKSKKKTRN